MFNLQNLAINTDSLNDKLFDEKNVTVSMLRLDAIHPVVSGNKIFKLFYFLEDAKNSIHKKVITFGGAYSNHIAATSFACAQLGLQSVGIIRGEKPLKPSHTLLFCIENGMQLEFISRKLFKEINEGSFHQYLLEKYGDHLLIPEGGFSVEGMNGAEKIFDYFNAEQFTHICCSIGTATTFAGLLKKSNDRLRVIGFSVLKNLHDIETRLKLLNVTSSEKYTVIHNYHFGGYAKKDSALILFMNSFYNKNKIELDFIYTAKMMFGTYDLIKKNFFSAGSKILCIHTGGLQGNKSLPEGLLIF